MMKIGITGSLASGKTTASRILSFKRGPLFSADAVVKKFYTKTNFKKTLINKFQINKNLNIKKEITKKILLKKTNIKKLEKIIHPLVRKEMNNFTKKHKKKQFVFFEVPLLIESRLMKRFDVIFFIKAKRKIRFQRFKLKGGEKKLFNLLDKRQLSEEKKNKYCDYVIVNEKNLKMLKKKLLDIFKQYERNFS